MLRGGLLLRVRLQRGCQVQIREAASRPRQRSVAARVVGVTVMILERGLELCTAMANTGPEVAAPPLLRVPTLPSTLR
jgi:hypothetical protein